MQRGKGTETHVKNFVSLNKNPYPAGEFTPGHPYFSMQKEDHFMGYRPSMTRQALDCLQEMQAFVASKHNERIANNGQTRKDRIYSKSTFNTYLDIGTHFANWAKDNFGCKTLDDARPHVGAYLEQRMLDGISAWTLHRDASALAKLYQCNSADFGVKLPPRYRSEISRYHNITEKMAEFEAEHPLLARACKSCGLRRHELRALRVEDVYVDASGNIRVLVRQGKGGRRREVYALDDSILQLAQMAQEQGRTYICRTIPPRAPLHGYRRIFAQATYAKFARPINQIPAKDRYVCRGDMQGIVLDKRAMYSVSKALCHNRLGIVTHYLFTPK